jgi:poly-gamma-glutamate synthesis protein (capsule biosynthesis protein)
MIFIGDVASPTEACSNDLYNSLHKSLNIFENDCVVANLEGLISDDYYRTNKPVLSNHPSVMKPLNLVNTKVVSLANNHSLDLPDNIQITKELLAANKIAHCGAGVDMEEAGQPAEIIHQNIEYLILGYSWDILMQHQDNVSGKMYVSPLVPSKILEKIKTLRAEKPKAKIVLKMHWNFDLETIPFPLHRTLSRAMIDAGADAIIGSHSHCVQGGERYKNGIIIYGLGNFFFPWYIFNSGKSYFPDWTSTELALQWHPETNEATCHFFKYNYSKEKHELEYLHSENFDDGTLINEHSPYRGMSDKEYVKWYKNNRRKGLLIPVYKNHKDVLRNSIIDFYLKKRIRFARFLAQHNLRGWKSKSDFKKI